MRITPNGTERVKRLRARYMQCPMMTDKLSYAMDRRQKLLFRRGWQKNAQEGDNLLRRSLAYAYMLEQIRPVIEEDELLVGQPDFSPLTEEEQAELRAPCDVAPSPGRESHMGLDFEKLLRLGVNGLIAELQAHADWESNYFYRGAVAELEGLLALEEHYAAYAESIGRPELAALLRRVPAYPAENFREALQSIHFYGFTLWGLYQAGRPDQYLLPYYRKDIASGRETPESAQELIDCFCLLYSTYILSASSIGFMVGGRDAQGHAVENELTWLFLNSIGHTHTADPSIGLCVTDETSQELMHFAAELIVAGHTHPAFYHDAVITQSLVDYGVPEPDAREYIHSCCVEITMTGKSSIWTVSPYHNVAGMLRSVMRDNESAASFEELFASFLAFLEEQIRAGNENENRWQAVRYENGWEPLRVSCLVDDCIARGRCINRGGAVYNQIQPNFLGLANTVDALMAVKRLVFEEKRLTLGELNRVLSQNFEGAEQLHAYIENKLPHFGNDIDECDALMDRITEEICRVCGTLTTFRGDIVVPASFSYNEHIRHGRDTGATADGRRAGEPLNDGSNPVQGHDRKGPVAMLNSCAAWKQSKFLGGIATNIELTKAQAQPEVVTTLIRGFFAKGGVEAQINVVDSEVLEDAQRNPGKHAGLIVRIGGYSDYFTSLSTALQDEVIRRSRF